MPPLNHVYTPARAISFVFAPGDAGFTRGHKLWLLVAVAVGLWRFIEHCAFFARGTEVHAALRAPVQLVALEQLSDDRPRDTGVQAPHKLLVRGRCWFGSCLR